MHWQRYLILKTVALMIMLPLLHIAALGQLAREQWGAPAVNVSRSGGKWIISGNKNQVTLDESDLSILLNICTTYNDEIHERFEDLI